VCGVLLMGRLGELCAVVLCCVMLCCVVLGLSSMSSSFFFPLARSSSLTRENGGSVA